MKTIFRYVYSMVIVILSLGIFSSCSDMVEDGNLSAMNNSPIGDFGEIQPLTLVIPDNKAIEEPFQATGISYGAEHEDELSIICMTFCKDYPLREFTNWALFVKVPNLKNLKKGQSLEIYDSNLSCMFSNNSEDYQSYIPNGASVIVREATDEYIDLYIDHLKFTFTSGFYMMNGDYYIFGDLRFLRSDIKGYIE